MSALRACRFGDRWELVRDVDGIGRRVGIVHDKADADRLIASEDLLAALRDYLELEHATDTYCERCERHAPKDTDGNIVGLLSHRDYCPRAAAESAIAKAEGRL